MRTRFYELCWFFLLGYFTYSLMEILFRGYTHSVSYTHLTLPTKLEV